MKPEELEKLLAETPAIYENRLLIWRAEEVSCIHCGHSWVAVFMNSTKQLECSKCGKFSPVIPLAE